jgi:hypothetical protein
VWVANIAFAVSGVACLAFGVSSLWQSGDLAAIGTGLTAGLVFLLASSIERFEMLKGLGVEARTRKLDEAINQATATVDQLRALATTVAQVTLTDLMSSNFMDGATLATRLSLHDKLLGTLKNLGVTSEQIAEADENWRRGIGVIYHRIIRHELGQRKSKNNVNFDAPKESQDAAHAFLDLVKFDEWKVPTPAEMESFINGRGLMTPELQAWVDDYRYFLTHWKLRRVEEFAKG